MRWFKKTKQQDPFLAKLLQKIYEKPCSEWERSYRLQGNGYPCVRSLSGNRFVDAFCEYRTSIGSFEIFLGRFHGDTGGSQPEAIVEYVLDVYDSEQGITAEQFINTKEVVNLYKHVESKILQELSEAKAQEEVSKAEKRLRKRLQARKRLNRLLGD